jgi:hypothetical protein
MKNSLVLSFVILVSIQCLAQTEAELTPEGKLGTKILLEHGINGHCFGIYETPQGVIISSRTEANVPVNYLYTLDKQLQKVDQLDRYIVFGYSPLKGDLLLGKHGHDPSGDSMCREVYTYNLATKKFLRQCDLGWIYGEPKYSAKFDSVILVVNEKNSDGIGSHYATKSVKLK